jgi:hypothetical protein
MFLMGLVGLIAGCQTSDPARFEAHDRNQMGSYWSGWDRPTPSEARKNMEPMGFGFPTGMAEQ